MRVLTLILLTLLLQSCASRNNTFKVFNHPNPVNDVKVEFMKHFDF